MHTRTFLRGVLALSAVLGLAASADAAVVIIDDFEGSEGHFNLDPDFSGSTAGQTVASGVGPSTADLDTTQFFTGAGSEVIFMDDNPAVNAPDGTSWRLRFLSGGGTISNNTPLDATGYVGYFLRTTTPNLRASILVDDGTTGHLERGTRTPIIADGQWHLYEWNLDDDTQWDGFAGTGVNGTIDAATVTIDALYIDALLAGDGSDQDATFNIDTVAHDPAGPIVIPEPTSLALTCLAALALFRRRRA